MPLDSVQKQLRVKLTKDLPLNEVFSLISCYETIALAEKDQFHLAYAHYYKAKYLSIQGEINKSNMLLKSIIPFFKKYKHNNFLHASLNCLGENKMKQGNVEEGIMHLKTVLALDNVSKENLAYTYQHSIKFLILFGAYDNALSKSRLALDGLSVQNKFERGQYLHILLETVEIFLCKKMPGKAIEILNKIKSVQDKFALQRVSSSLYEKYGKYYTHLQKHDQAARYYQKAIIHSDNKKLHCHSLKNRIFLAETYISQDKLEEAEKILILAFNNYKQEEKSSFLSLLNNLVIVYQMQGNKTEQNRFEEELQMHSV